MEMAYTLAQTGINMKENGKITCHVVTESLSTAITRHIKVNFTTENGMEEEPSSKMDQNMLVSSRMIKLTALPYSLLIMVKPTMESGKKTQRKVLGSIDGRMVIVTWETIRRGGDRDMG